MARVLAIESKRPKDLDASGKPTHWDDKKGSKFHNPWDSWRGHSVSEKIGLAAKLPTLPTPNPSSLNIRVRKPTWGSEFTAAARRDKIQAIWLGHACFFVEFPSRVMKEGDNAATAEREEGGDTKTEGEEERGIRILFDPVFQPRCSPTEWFGPKRFTPPPCEVIDIPPVDAVVISHNHYDHLEQSTIQTLSILTPQPHFFAPLGNHKFFIALGIPEGNVHVLDWWDSKCLTLDLGGDERGGRRGEGTRVAVDLTCTPAQHNSGRSPLDMCKSLWGTWVVEEVIPPPVSSGASGPAEERPRQAATQGEKGQTLCPKKLFFAGDTGYRTVLSGENEDTVPSCPAFRQIGETFGGVDGGLIPIGAYEPRQFMSRLHASPQDSVRIFQDVRAKRGVGMHWGTYAMTWEHPLDPPTKLLEECRKLGIGDGAFAVCEVGETVLL